MPGIVIDKQERQLSPTSTRSRVQPILAQHIVVSETKTQPRSNATIESTRLVIPFKELFLRPLPVAKATSNLRTRT